MFKLLAFPLSSSTIQPDFLQQGNGTNIAEFLLSSDPSCSSVINHHTVGHMNESKPKQHILMFIRLIREMTVKRVREGEGYDVQKRSQGWGEHEQ